MKEVLFGFGPGQIKLRMMVDDDCQIYIYLLNVPNLSPPPNICFMINFMKFIFSSSMFLM